MLGAATCSWAVCALHVWHLCKVGSVSLHLATNSLDCLQDISTSIGSQMKSGFNSSQDCTCWKRCQHLPLDQDGNSCQTIFGYYGTEELGTLEYKNMILVNVEPLARATATHLQVRRVHFLGVAGISLSRYKCHYSMITRLALGCKPAVAEGAI